MIFKRLKHSCIVHHKRKMTYTGDVESFSKLIEEGTKNEDGTVTISVPAVKEPIDDEYLFLILKIHLYILIFIL